MQGYGGVMAQSRQQDEQRKRAEMQMQMQQEQLAQMRAQAQERAEAGRVQATDDGIMRRAFQPMPGPMPDGGSPLMPRFDPAGMLSQGMSINSLPRAQALDQMMRPAAPRAPTVSKPGDIGRDENNQIVFRNPEKAPADDEFTQLMRRSGVDPQSPQGVVMFQQMMKRKLAPPVGPVVNVNTLFETAFSKASGGQFAEMYGGINTAAFRAPSRVRNLERIEQLLQGVDGGRLAPTGMELASAANSFGIKLDPKLGNKQAAESLTAEIAINMRQPGTGPMTDKDLEVFFSIVPSLSKTAEGRKQITQTMRASAARDLKMGKLARDYVSRNGKLDEGFMEIAGQFMAENPVISLPQGWTVTPLGGK